MSCGKQMSTTEMLAIAGVRPGGQAMSDDYLDRGISLSDGEPTPIPNKSAPIWDLVIEDMRERDVVGRLKYGTALQAHNGRDPLVDAYQEALDLVVYLRQAIEEHAMNMVTGDKL